MRDISITFEQRVHGFVHLAEVDAEVLVLGEDVGVERLAAQLGLVHSVGHTLVNPVNLRDKKTLEFEV